MDEERNDSGINSGSEFQSSSPGSDHSQDLSYSKLAQDLDNTLIPTNQEEDPLRRLQMALETNGLFNRTASPKPSENSLDDDNKSDGEEYDEQSLRVPKMNSHGKIKTFKCKQCDFVAITKLKFWEHSKIHIKADKLLTCHKCPFVTEYKHHLEYHLNNHFGSKPFKCGKCSYSCVNKSMLNSHMKSHSNIYPYRCADCTYASKYLHSLKLHLRKYSHKPAPVLNPDGTPNPLPIIDVYGTRRGPKNGAKLIPHQQKNDEPEQQNLLQHPLAQLMMKTPFPYPFLSGFPQLLFPQFNAQPPEIAEKPPSPNADGVLDLSKPECSKSYSYSSDEDEDDDTSEEPPTTNNNNNNNKSGNLMCQYCNISFGDMVLYTMHMGYHGYKNPFTCNMCGEECNDKVSFFLHIARTPHS